ncbi:MAG TPA: sugar ABC transporter substrate-binding protein [Stellaceae bacterium]|nr:sugar ABC transporter substrate-binding protein [Stellaceae bacterium]
MNGKGRRLGLAAVAVGVTLAFALHPPAGKAAPAAHPFTLGYSVGFLTDPFQAIQVNLTMAEAKKAGIKTLPVANANGDAGKQITDFHNLIAEGAQGIIVVARDSDAIVPALDFAAGKHVPVVSIDIGPAGGKAAMIVRADNLRMGEDACQSMGKALGGKGTVLSLMGDQATINGRDRTSGFNECMKKNFAAIKVIQEPTYWKTDKATAVAQTVVTSTPNLAGIYMQSDSVMLAGVLNVLKSAGKLKEVGQPGHIFLVSIDGTPLALQKVREGWLDAAISQPLDLYVKYGLQYLEEAVAGQTFHPGPTDHDSRIVEFKSNLMDLLPAPVVTRANAADPKLWGNQAKG